LKVKRIIFLESQTNNFFYFKKMELYGIGEKEKDKILSLLSSKKLSEKQIREELKNPEIFKELKTDTQVDLLYEPLRKIPRKVIDRINLLLIRSKLEFTIAGSYRRGKSYSGDIDIVSPHSFKDFAETDLVLLRPFACGDDITRTLCYVCGHYVKIDFFTCAVEDYAAYILYATGSKEFNIAMRIKAKKMGFLLNQKGLWRGDKKIPVKSEREFFEILEIEYVEPYDR